DSMATTETASKEHYKALENDTVPATFQFTANRVPDRPALRTLDGSFEITWADYNGRVKRAAAALAGLGLKKGDTLALMMVNRQPEGRADHAPQHRRDGPLIRADRRLPRRWADRLLPADGARRRTQRLALPADGIRLHSHVRREPARSDAGGRAGSPDLVLRR